MYKIDENAGRILKYNGREETVNIPSEVDGVKITSIGKDAFFGNSFIKSVIIPQGVLTIEEDAFGRCENLKAVGLPNTVETIKEGAFIFCTNLEVAMLGEGLKTIERHAFLQCPLGIIDIPKGVEEIGFRAFWPPLYYDVDANNPNFRSENGVLFNQDFTTLLSCPVTQEGEYRIPHGVTHIEDYAFFGCKGIDSIKMPDTVLFIGASAFECCELKDINLSANLEVIEEFALSSHGSVEEFTIPDPVKIISQNAFSFCGETKKINIGKGVINIEAGAFIGSDVEIDVHKGNQFFSSEDGVLFDKNKTVLLNYPSGRQGKYIVPESVVVIEEGAFIDSKMEEIIGHNVKAVETHAFLYCKKLKNVELPNVEELEYDAFFNCENITTVVMPSEFKAKIDQIFYNSHKIQEINSGLKLHLASLLPNEKNKKDLVI